MCTAEDKELEELGTRKDRFSHTPIHLAAQDGHIELLELLMTGANVKSAFDEKTFNAIAIRGHRAIFDIMYNHTDTGPCSVTRFLLYYKLIRINETSVGQQRITLLNAEM